MNSVHIKNTTSGLIAEVRGVVYREVCWQVPQPQYTVSTNINAYFRYHGTWDYMGLTNE